MIVHLELATYTPVYYYSYYEFTKLPVSISTNLCNSVQIQYVQLVTSSLQFHSYVKKSLRY